MSDFDALCDDLTALIAVEQRLRERMMREEPGSSEGAHWAALVGEANDRISATRRAIQRHPDRDPDGGRRREGA